MFFAMAGMVPPDRNMFRTPGAARDASSATQPVSSLEKFIRYAEKDDWLLYITAMFGILMPGIMYLLYRKAHNVYNEYYIVRKQQKRDERKRQKENNKRMELTIFYCGTGTTVKKLAFDAAEKLENMDPLVVKLADTDLDGFKRYKGVCLFIVNAEHSTDEPPEVNVLFEWLKETRFKQRDAELLNNVAFSVIALSEDHNHDDNSPSIIEKFKIHFSKLGANELCDSAICQKAQLTDYFDVWMTEIRYKTKRIGLGASGSTVRRRKQAEYKRKDSGSDTAMSYLTSDDDTDHEKFD